MSDHRRRWLSVAIAALGLITHSSAFAQLGSSGPIGRYLDRPVQAKQVAQLSETEVNAILPIVEKEALRGAHLVGEKEDSLGAGAASDLYTYIEEKSNPSGVNESLRSVAGAVIFVFGMWATGSTVYGFPETAVGGRYFLQNRFWNAVGVHEVNAFWRSAIPFGLLAGTIAGSWAASTSSGKFESPLRGGGSYVKSIRSGFAEGEHLKKPEKSARSRVDNFIYRLRIDAMGENILRGAIREAAVVAEARGGHLDLVSAVEDQVTPDGENIVSEESLRVLKNSRDFYAAYDEAVTQSSQPEKEMTERERLEQAVAVLVISKGYIEEALDSGVMARAEDIREANLVLKGANRALGQLKIFAAPI